MINSQTAPKALERFSKQPVLWLKKIGNGKAKVMIEKMALKTVPDTISIAECDRIFQDNLEKVLSLAWEMIAFSEAVQENGWTKSDLKNAILKGIQCKNTAVSTHCSVVEVGYGKIYRMQGFNNYWSERKYVIFNVMDMLHDKDWQPEQYIDGKKIE
jgi:hypothetical protein